MSIGKEQLRTLMMVASPFSIMLTRDRSSDGLVKRGLLRRRDAGLATCITPAGLRVLADEMEAGHVDDALTAIKKEVAKRKAKRKVRK